MFGVTVFSGPYRELSVYLESDTFTPVADASVSVYGIRYCPYCGKGLTEEAGEGDQEH